ncbi:MAG: outer membrane beta-barrel protein [Acidobacteria bacterium]|nr:outer membrane beta-barrel protein [Acidobacteriota bacterium]
MDARLLLHRSLGVAIVLLMCSPAAAQEAQPKPRKHHVSLQPGVFNNSAEGFEFGGLDLDAGRDTFYGAVSYRYSLNPSIDLALHAGHWIGQWTTATSHIVELASGFIGPGVRVNGRRRAAGRVVPYLQTNVYFVQEQLVLERAWSKRVTQNAFGVGLMGGLDVALGERVSIPIEVIYLATTGNAGIDDLSGVGLSIGVDLSF